MTKLGDDDGAQSVLLLEYAIPVQFCSGELIEPFLPSHRAKVVVVVGGRCTSFGYCILWKAIFAVLCPCARV